MTQLAHRPASGAPEPGDEAQVEARRAVRRARRGPLRRRRITLAVLSLLVFGAFAARVLLGDFTITIPDFFRIVTGAQIPGATYELMESKLPRAVLGALVGIAFGVGGALFQTALRNPLASPDIIGISLGASAAAVFAIVELGLIEPSDLSIAAILGALVVAIVIRLVAGTLQGYRLVLVGVGMAAALSSAIQYLFTRADIYDAQLGLRWLTGSLKTASWEEIRIFWVFLAVALGVLAWLLRALPITELGEDTARGLGVPGHRLELILVIGVVLIAGAVAVVGPVAFVSFLSGPIAKSLNGGRTTILGAGLVGALTMLSADYVAAYLLGDTLVPVGVITGAFGAPFLIWLLISGRTGRRAS